MFQNLHRMMGSGGTLKIECGACGRRTVWARWDACERLGSHTTPADIRRRLLCSGCGKIGLARVWI